MRFEARRGAGLLGAAVVAALLTMGAAQAPVVNAVVEHRRAANGMAREIQAIAQQGRTVWVAYRVPIVRSRGDRLNSTQTCCGRCRLEPPVDLVMLLRIDRTGVMELRSEAADCDIDASGAALIWLDNVSPEDSVSWLASVARGVA